MNAEIVSVGKAICRELGCAVVTGRAGEASLPAAESVRRFCHAHHLQALYASALSLRGAVPKEFEPLIALGVKQTAKQLKIDAAEEALSRRFTKEGIRHTVLKGSHMRAFYPASLSRPSADIDWQIAPADVKRADAWLSGDGWTLMSESAHERCYEKAPRARLELHITPEGFHKTQQRVIQSLLDRAVKTDGLRFQLTDNDAYVYAVFHLYKHFVQAGAGVRMFLDVFAMDTHAVLDRAYLDEAFEALGCAGFAARVRQINEVLFGGVDGDDDLEMLIRYVFAGGAYGDKTVQLALEPLNAAVTHRTGFERFLRNYGFSMASMKKRYPCLERAAVLYPFCAIHRVCYGWRFRRNVAHKVLDERHQSRMHRADWQRILELAAIL